MIKNAVTEQDLHFTAGDLAAVMAAGGDDVSGKCTGFEAMEEDHHQLVQMSAVDDRDLWLDENMNRDDSLIDVNDASIFYHDFPPLPDFHCMSSSSSSTSTPAVSVPLAATSSSSSAASSSPAVFCATTMKKDPSEDGNNIAVLSSTASTEFPPPSGDDCLSDPDVMEGFGYMDLIDCNEIWDPSSVFQTENTHEFLEGQPDCTEVALAHPPSTYLMDGEQNTPQSHDENDGFASFLQGNSELAAIFFDWLKQNKDYISAEDMRSIKLKRSTIESAARRLGTDKEGKKQLLKLILEWVEQHQLQKKRVAVQTPDPNPNPNFAYNSPMPPDPNMCYPATSPWVPPPHAMPSPGYPPPIVGYNGDPYTNPIPIMHMTHQVVNGISYPHPAEYSVMDRAEPWHMSPLMPMAQPQFSPYPDNGSIVNHQHTMYGITNNVYDPNGERLTRFGPSATKEARKKRMARQKRLYSHHHHRHSNNNQNRMSDIHDSVGDGGGEDGPDGGGIDGNWTYWTEGGPSSDPTGGNVSGDGPQPVNGDRAAMRAQKNATLDRRQQQQGWKSEKNMKFLLQKVLKQSDVGNLGRIVLPKKEAEGHLPELETRDGITIAMEDIGTSRVWNMRYRFWPNNKSRMYLLENTGDFVRANGLQEGDFIVIYSDTKCGKYMIRGVKVRQTDTKPEIKKPARRNMRNLSISGNNSSSLTPIKQAVR